MRALQLIFIFSLFIFASCGQAQTTNDDVKAKDTRTADPNKMDETSEEKEALDAAPAAEMMEFGSLIEPGNVGEIAVGMDISELKSVFGDDNVVDAVRSDEGEEYDVLEINDNAGNLLFEITPLCENGTCTVDRILVFTPDYLTVNGLGVGSTFAEIEAAHTGLDIFAGGLGIMVYTKEMKKVAYVLKVQGLVAEPNQEFTPSEILNDSKVIAVYTF